MKEVEVRYKIDDEIYERIKENSEPVKAEEESVDIVFGYDGFNSLQNRGYIIRIRQKKDKIYLECKKRIDEISWNEERVELDSIKQGFNLLTNMKMAPYLCIKRKRERRKIEGAIIELDDIDLLGKYVEIELDGYYDFEQILSNFLNEINIPDNRQPLYGDIFKESLEKDEKFKEKFNVLLNRIVKKIKLRGNK